MSQFSIGTHNRPEITTLFSPPQAPSQPDLVDNRFAITRNSLGKTLLVLALLPFFWGVYIGAYHYWHPAPTLWTRADATLLDGKIQMTRDVCSAGLHSGHSIESVPKCDYYVFRFAVSYFVEGAARQSKIDSPLFEHKHEAEMWAAQLASDRRLTIIYDPLQVDRVRLADDPPRGLYAVGPSIAYYPLGMSGPEIVYESVTGPLEVALCFFLPGIFLLLSSRSGKDVNPIAVSRYGHSS